MPLTFITVTPHDPHRLLTALVSAVLTDVRRTEDPTAQILWVTPRTDDATLAKLRGIPEMIPKLRGKPFAFTAMTPPDLFDYLSDVMTHPLRETHIAIDHEALTRLTPSEIATLTQVAETAHVLIASEDVLRGIYSSDTRHIEGILDADPFGFYSSRFKYHRLHPPTATRTADKPNAPATQHLAPITA